MGARSQVSILDCLTCLINLYHSWHFRLSVLFTILYAVPRIAQDMDKQLSVVSFLDWPNFVKLSFVAKVLAVHCSDKIFKFYAMYSASGILTTIAVILDAFWVTLISGSPYNVVNIYLLSGAYIARTIDYIYNIYCVFTWMYHTFVMASFYQETSS